MVRSRAPKKLRRVCRMIFQMIEKDEKKVFPVKPQRPRGIIALVFEGSKLFILHAGDTSPLRTAAQRPVVFHSVNDKPLKNE